MTSSHGHDDDDDDDENIFHKTVDMSSSLDIDDHHPSPRRLLPPMRVTGDRGTLHLANCSVPMCEGGFSRIYCSGRFVATTWQYGLEATCPGQMMLRSAQEILAAFDQTPLNISKADFQKFCDQNFANTSYLEPTELTDWQENPPNLDVITEPGMKEFAKRLNAIWKTLGRRFTEDVRTNPDRHPVMAIPNPFVVPGGFFQVYYYWDSYWIIKGLLFSGMKKTVKDMLDNFSFIIDKTQGYIPNAGDIRLSRRSQPPLFTQMVADYYEVTKDRDYLQKIVPQLERELKFWQGRTYRSLYIGGRLMYQYRANTNCPRPENYNLDFINGINGTNAPNFTWSSIASACESGWDFSSRWFAHSGAHADTKYSIRTNYILPVDLNVFMCLNYATMARFYRELGNETIALKYDEMHAALHEAIDKVFWNEKAGVWLDYDLNLNVHRNRFYPSNVFPLMTKNISMERITRVINYLDESGALNFKGGVPTSMVDTGEQWDMPNGWAPMIHLFVTSLRASGHKMLIERASDVALKWIKTAYNGLMQPAKGFSAGMWEKYDVRFDDGRPGIGGEYVVQEGFGWTNGAVLDLMLTYFDVVKAPLPHPFEDKESRHSSVDFLRSADATPQSGWHSVIVVSSIVLCFFVLFW
uniref:Trehalase n=1 Tax=Plectus sambesii TaxID=2011161 RepID=A0A914V4B0_9BILA